MLAKSTERAMTHIRSQQVLVVSSVGSNIRLQQIMDIIGRNRRGSVFVTDKMFCINNGIIIAYADLLEYINRVKTESIDTTCTQRFGIDKVFVGWRTD